MFLIRLLNENFKKKFILILLLCFISSKILLLKKYFMHRTYCTKTARKKLEEISTILYLRLRDKEPFNQMILSFLMIEKDE